MSLAQLAGDRGQHVGGRDHALDDAVLVEHDDQRRGRSRNSSISRTTGCPRAPSAAARPAPRDRAARRRAGCRPAGADAPRRRFRRVRRGRRDSGCARRSSAARIGSAVGMTSSQTTSTRGVMIERTGRSAMCMTPSIISCSTRLTTPACAPSASSARISSSVTRGPAVADAEQAQDGVGRGAQQPDRAPTQAGQASATGATRLATRSGFGQRQPLRHQLADDQGQVGDAPRPRRRCPACRRSAGDSPARPASAARWPTERGAAERTGQDADQGDADLHGREEGGRVVEQPQGRRGAAIALPAPAAPAGRGATTSSPARTWRARR